MPTPNLGNPTNDPNVDAALRWAIKKGLLGVHALQQDLDSPEGMGNMARSGAAGLLGLAGDIESVMPPMADVPINAPFTSGFVPVGGGLMTSPGRNRFPPDKQQMLPTTEETAELLNADLTRPGGLLGLFGMPDPWDFGRVGMAMAPIVRKGGKGAKGGKQSKVGGLLGTRVADDLARVNFPEEVPAPPELTRASTKPGKGGRIIGAPAHVKTRRHERKIINDYLTEAEAGAGGRDWYDLAAKRVDTDTGNLSGARPGAADQSAAVIGEFSPRATLAANRLAQVRATNQHAVGLPVAAGMGPRNKAAQGLLDEGKFAAEEALKVGPFSMQVRGLDAPRGVHDVRDLQALGFDRGFTPGVANHRWMDKITDEMVVEANKRKLGGFDDWTHKQLQASRWVKHKADEEGIPVESLFGEFGPADDFLRANVFSEAVPSKELVEGGLLSDDAARAYTTDFQRQFSNPEGQNALAQQQGLLAPEQVRFVGEWEGATNPNVVTTILADPAKGADVMSSWSAEAVNFHGALEGLLGGQADVAVSYLRKSSNKGDVNAARITFGRAVTEDDLTSYSGAIRKGLREADVPGNIAPNYRSSTELEVTWLPPFEVKKGEKGYKEWKKWQELSDVALPAYEIKAAARTPEQKAAVKEMNRIRKSFRDVVDKTTSGRAIEARNSGGLLTYENTYKPSAYLEHLQNPTMRAKVKDMLPKIAGDLRRTIKELPLTKKGKEVYQKALELMESGGLEAIEDAVKQGILPAAVIGALLAANQVPEQPAPSQGLL